MDVATKKRKLAMVKLLHTAVWIFFVGCIAVIPIASMLRQFRLAELLAGVVFVECAVLGVNKGRCPLTTVARRYSDSSAANFDIYLPEWLARRNKLVFGMFFVADLLLLIWQFV